MISSTMFSSRARKPHVLEKAATAALFAFDSALALYIAWLLLAT